MNQGFYEFGEYRIDALQRILWRGETAIRLTGREFDTLLALARHAGTPVDKAALIAAVWPDTHVSDDNLRQHVRGLRQKLGKDPNGQEYIRNVPNRGYFLAASVCQRVERSTGDSNTLTPEAQPPQMASEQLDQPHQPRELANTSPIRKKRRRSGLALGLIVSGATITLAIFLLTDHIMRPSAATPQSMGRLLTRLTSEGKSIPHVAISHPAEHLAISTDGSQLFVTTGYRPVLSIINTGNLTVREVRLPRDAGPMAVTRNGKLLIGSSVDGVMVWDIVHNRLLPTVVPTGGPVLDMVVTPDDTKAFLSLGTAGLKRLTLGKMVLAQISDRVSPQLLAMDRQGMRLFVSYQNEGPGGQRGHDVVELFDSKKEASLGVVSGPPMVGGSPAVAPNGGLVLLDGVDACASPQYDHLGCSVIPSRVFHLLRPSDRQILKSFSYPVHHGPARFLDDSRFLLLGASISVVDARKYTVLENFDLGDDNYRSIVIAPDGRRVFVGGLETHEVLALDPEPADCLPPQLGLSLWYSGDGTLDDAAGLTKLERRGNAAFAPGKVGQAFFLDGGGGHLVAPWIGGYEFGSQDATLTLYARFAELRGEQTLAYRMSKGEAAGMVLRKDEEDRLVFQMTASDGKLLSVKTSGPLSPGKWYQIIVTKDDDGLVLYVDGSRENALKAGPGRPPGPGLETPLILGARGNGGAALHGWLDEVMFYSRALSADEVKALYQARESGACKL